jgi:hypothetical protein
MEEEFYATIKLTSGEEIVAKVSYDPDDDVIVVLEPRVIEKVQEKKNGTIVEGIVFDDWINATYDTMFIIPRNQIITMIELDSKLILCYEDHLQDRSKYKKINSTQSKSNNKRQNPRNQEGFLGSIKEAKKLLEEIYNKS